MKDERKNSRKKASETHRVLYMGKRRIARLSTIGLCLLGITALIVGASVLQYVMISSITVNVNGTEATIKVNGNTIPYDEVKDINIESGQTITDAYIINNTGNYTKDIYLSTEGFVCVGLNVSINDGVSPITFIVVGGHSEETVYVTYTADDWILTDTITGTINFDTTP